MKPLPRDNPDVEAQRPGFCVFSPTLNRFMTSKDATCWGRAADAFVFPTHSAGKHAATLTASQLTTVPRFNGFTYEWTEVP